MLSFRILSTVAPVCDLRHTASLPTAKVVFYSVSQSIGMHDLPIQEQLIDDAKAVLPGKRLVVLYVRP